MKYALPLMVSLALAAGWGCRTDDRGLVPADASMAGAAGGVNSAGGVSASGGAAGGLGDAGVPISGAGARGDGAFGSGGGAGTEAAAGSEDASGGSGGTSGTDAAVRWVEAPDSLGTSGADAADSYDGSDGGGISSADVGARLDEAQDRGGVAVADGAVGLEDASWDTSVTDVTVDLDSAADSRETAGRDAGLGSNDDAGNDGRSAVDAGDAGASWRLVWSDEFNLGANTGADTAKWNVATSDPGTVNGEKQKYTARTQNVFHDGQGHLVLRGRHDSWNSNGTVYPYTSGRLQSDGKYQFRLGRVEVRAKLPAGQGSFPAILLMGTSGTWPQSGEIGMMEQWGQDKSWLDCSTYSGAASDISQKVTFPNATTVSSDFHVYALEWYADHMVFFIDDAQVARSNFNMTSIFYTGTYYIILDVAIGGTMGGTVDDAGGFPMDFVLDYVRVYAQQ